MTSTIIKFSSAEALDLATADFIQKTDSVLDIGCGIRPQAYFKPRIHLCIEPYQEYIDILQNRFQNEPGFMVLKGMGQQILPLLLDKSVDSIFLIDVIEHITKEDGIALLSELLRIARKQIILFTPFGFMPQEYEQGDKDAWGLGGVEFQEHKSGWTPDDFKEAGWNFYVCDNYHSTDSKQKPLEKPYGAFWAVYDVPEEKSELPQLPQKTLFVGDYLLPRDEPSFKNFNDLLLTANPASFGIASLHRDLTPYGLTFQRYKNRLACPYYFYDLKMVDYHHLNTAKYVFYNIVKLFSLIVMIVQKKYKVIVSVSDFRPQHIILKLVALITFCDLVVIYSGDTTPTPSFSTLLQRLSVRK